MQSNIPIEITNTYYHKELKIQHEKKLSNQNQIISVLISIIMIKYFLN